MNFDKYQELASRTAGSFEEKDKIFWILISTLGLAGEAGEVSDYLKKVYGHKHQLDIEKLKKELGDVLWYLSDICTKFGISFNEVAIMNVEKLKNRYPNGFSTEVSQNRQPGDI